MSSFIHHYGTGLHSPLGSLAVARNSTATLPAADRSVAYEEETRLEWVI
jgi:hypothetical protein